jgi:hypothetical protein
MYSPNPAMRIPNDFERSLHPLELVNLAPSLERIKPVDSLAELVHIQPEFIGNQQYAEDFPRNRLNSVLLHAPKS